MHTFYFDLDGCKQNIYAISCKLHLLFAMYLFDCNFGCLQVLDGPKYAVRQILW